MIQSTCTAPWEIVASATGARGTTFAILREELDGFRLRDRCAEGLTEDGTAIDAVYACRLAAMQDAIRLVDLWVMGPCNESEGCHD